MAATEFGGNEGFTSMKFGVGGNKKGSIDLLGARRTAKGLQVRGGRFVRNRMSVRVQRQPSVAQNGLLTSGTPLSRWTSMAL